MHSMTCKIPAACLLNLLNGGLPETKLPQLPDQASSDTVDTLKGFQRTCDEACCYLDPFLQYVHFLCFQFLHSAGVQGLWKPFCILANHVGADMVPMLSERCDNPCKCVISRVEGRDGGLD